MSRGYDLIFKGKVNGFDCEIREIEWSGHLCGYVKIPEGHPSHGKDYFDIDVDVHGGLTYGQFRDDGYWIGFDCAHFGDLLPKSPSRFGGVFRDKEYVLRELKHMTEQIAEFKDAKEEN